LVINWTSVPPNGIIADGGTLTPTVNQGGTYTLTLTNPDNGCTDSGSVTVTENTEVPDAVANAEEEFDCITDEVQLNGNGSSTGPQFSYSWSGSGIVGPGNTFFVTINLPGTYTLTVLNNQNGCTATDQVLVNENTSVPTSLEAVVTPPVCYGDRGTVEVTE